MQLHTDLKIARIYLRKKILHKSYPKRSSNLQKGHSHKSSLERSRPCLLQKSAPNAPRVARAIHTPHPAPRPAPKASPAPRHEPRTASRRCRRQRARGRAADGAGMAAMPAGCAARPEASAPTILSTRRAGRAASTARRLYKHPALGLARGRPALRVASASKNVCRHRCAENQDRINHLAGLVGNFGHNR